MLKLQKKNWGTVGWSLSWSVGLSKYFFGNISLMPRVDGLDVTASAPPSMGDMWSGWTVNIETVFEMVPLIIITMSSKYSPHKKKKEGAK